MPWGMSRVSLRFVDLFRMLGPAKDQIVKNDPTGCVAAASGDYTPAVACFGDVARSKTNTRRQYIRAIFVAVGASIAATTLLPAKTRVREVAFHDNLAMKKRTFALPDGSVELAQLERALEFHASSRVQPPTESYAFSKWEAELSSHYAKNLNGTGILSPNDSEDSSALLEHQTQTHALDAKESQTDESRKIPDPPSLSAEDADAGNGIAQTAYSTPVTQVGNFEMPAIDTTETAEPSEASAWNPKSVRSWQSYWENRHATAIAQIEASAPSPSDRKELISQITLGNWKVAPRPTWHVIFILGIALTSFGVAQRAPIHQPSSPAPANLPLYAKNRVEVPKNWVSTPGPQSWFERLRDHRTPLQIMRMFWVEAITTIMMIVWICG